MPQSAPTSKVSSVEKTTGTVLSMQAFGHLLVVDRQCPGAAFAGAAAVVGEVEADRAGAVGQRLCGSDRVVLAAEPVVVEGRLGVLHYERVAAGLAADGYEDAFGFAVGVVDLRGEREGAVLDVDDGVLGDPDGARTVTGSVTGDESWALGGQQCEALSASG